MIVLIFKFIFFKEHLYNPNSKTNSKGFIENYIRNQRSSNPIYEQIKGKYGKRKVEELILEGELLDEAAFEENVTFLRHKVARTSNDRDKISKKMLLIHVNRYIWIQETAPTLTDILNKYPRYIDCVELVCYDLFFQTDLFILKVYFFFKVNDDFKNWFPSIESESLLQQWDKVQAGIYKISMNSRNPYIKQLLVSYNEKLEYEGKYFLKIF